LKTGRSDHEISEQPLVRDKTQWEQIKLKLDGQETKSIKTNSPRGSTLNLEVTCIVTPGKRKSKQSLSQDDSKKKKVVHCDYGLSNQPYRRTVFGSIEGKSRVGADMLSGFESKK